MLKVLLFLILFVRSIDEANILLCITDDLFRLPLYVYGRCILLKLINFTGISRSTCSFDNFYISSVT